MSIVTSESAEIADDLPCPECGYNLRGLTSERCPECGYALASLRSTRSGIPWAYRREIGWLRAYWRTVLMVTRRPARLCEEMARPVSFADAQLFRWISVAHAYFPLALIAGLSYAFVRRPFQDAVLNGWYAAVWPMLVVHVGFLLFLAAATGVPSYFFYPRTEPIRMQNRAVALSYYACGVLAWCPLVVLVLGSTMSAYAYVNLLAVGSVLVGIHVLLVLEFVMWWIVLRRMARRILANHRRRVVVLGSLLPILWAALFLVTVVGIPLLAYVSSVLASLR